MKKPKISIIMSVFNGEKDVENSIKSILSQTFKDFEFIIIDDKSADNTLKIIKKYKDKRIRVIANPKNLGLTKSLNKAFNIAKGKYIARIDCGDKSTKERLMLQNSFLDKNPEVGIVGSFMEIVTEKGRVIKNVAFPTTDKEIRKRIVYANCFSHSSLMFRKNVGEYDSSFRYSQDYEFILRSSKKWKLANINKSLVTYKFSEKSISFGKSAKQQERFALKARWLAVTKYRYPKWQIVYFIKPLISYLIPTKIKLKILRLMGYEN